MYKVLLVDDERIILEGIANVIEWEAHGTTLAGKAVDGKEAFEFIRQSPPDIVITDIRMPEMNGIELIERTMELYPQTIFIILSGHEEFSWAQNAMKHGVRHYLLKPCNEKQIMDVIEEAVSELRERARREHFILENKESLSKVLPQIKEQFLKEALTNKTYGPREWDYYGELFQLDMHLLTLRLLLFEIEGEHEFEHLFALHNITLELSQKSGVNVYLNTTLSERLVLLVEDGPLEKFLDMFRSIKRIYQQYYRLDVTVAVSSSGSMKQMRQMYHETLECLSYRFYLGEGSVITPSDVLISKPLEEEITVDHDRLALAVRSGNQEETSRIVNETIGKLKSSKADVSMVQSYVIELFLIIVRQAPQNLLDENLRKLFYSNASYATLDQAEKFILQTAQQITQIFFDSNLQSQSRIVRQVIQYVEEHIQDESLSLSKLAHEIFYLNVDYLGKLFRKETGEKFSNYLVQVRMEKAKQFIESSEHCKMQDVAAKVGYGTNPQYFSQVFKRYTGFTPSEFKRLSVRQDFNH
ncbi:response regulator transcription factor [Marinicrinis lubricantis]|uniref:Response regulator n=1 Tax=Marinicrinis lubricantis TaxID=2086470 RepID=A0ABW1IQI0_9BACL